MKQTYRFSRNGRWTRSTTWKKDYEKVIELCDQVRPLALQYWNHSHNIRPAQLCEKEFEAYWRQMLYAIRRQAGTSQSSAESGTPSSMIAAEFEETLKATLDVGEAMMKPYMRYSEPYNLAIAILCHRMGSLYRLSHDNTAPERGSRYFLAAADIWNLHGEPGCVSYFEGLSKRILVKKKPPPTEPRAGGKAATPEVKVTPFESVKASAEAPAIIPVLVIAT